MVVYSAAFLCVFLVSTCFGAGHNTFESYPFTLTLTEGYDLYWNVSFAEQTIHFGVKVKTTGWVGFGISPNGQMPGSDVVIGWVDDDGKAYFHDRYAERRSTPPIDNSQDWFLLSGVIHDGYTEMEFSRNFTTCDNESTDLSILPDTSRVVYSWNDATPTVTRNNDGTESYSLVPHQAKGSASVNLLGGQPNPPTIPDNAQQFTVAVSDITLPNSDTTYWCKGVALDSVIQDTSTAKYIIEFSPSIAASSVDYVHHMLIYTCNTLNTSDVETEGGPCHQQSEEVQQCRGDSGILIAAWAVGGTEFVYPENVAYPIGGPNSHQYFVIETHYNNPSMNSGVTDSSGLTFTYINERREHDAGVLLMGHSVYFSQMIPPKATNYTVRSFCTSTCTQQFLPPTGINIFANTLHTHLAGTGATLSVVRDNGDGTYKEVNIIEKNLNYDFNFQQASFLSEEVTVLPGDVLLLNCYYNTADRTTATFGGESTHEEMCLSFPIYYPRVEMGDCSSIPEFDAITPFVIGHVPQDQHPLWVALGDDFTKGNINKVVNALDWTEERLNALERAVYVTGKQTGYCYSTAYGNQTVERILEVSQYSSQPAPVRNCTLREGSGEGSPASIARVSGFLLVILVIAASLTFLN